MNRFPLRPRWSRPGRAVLALLVAGALLAGCRSGSPEEGFSAPRALLTGEDVPVGWVPVQADEFPFSLPSPLIDLLMADSTVEGAFSAFRDESGLRGAASLVVLRDASGPFWPSEPSAQALHPLAELVAEQERLVRLTAGPAGAPVNFALTDVPHEGSLRGRTVLQGPSGGYLFSDSLLFSQGSALVLVTVHYPEEEGPFSPVEILAATVYERVLGELARLPSPPDE